MSDLECTVELSDGQQLSFEGSDLQECYEKLIAVRNDNPQCEIVKSDVTDLETGEIRMSYDMGSGWEVAEGALPPYLVDEQRDWKKADARTRYDDVRERIDHGVPYYNSKAGVAVYRDAEGSLYVAQAPVQSVGEAFEMFSNTLPPNVYRQCDVSDAVAFLSDKEIFRSRAVEPILETEQEEAIAEEIGASPEWQMGDHARITAVLEEAGYRVRQSEKRAERARGPERQPSTIETIISRKGR